MITNTKTKNQTNVHSCLFESCKSGREKKKASQKWSDIRTRTKTNRDMNMHGLKLT